MRLRWLVPVLFLVGCGGGGGGGGGPQTPAVTPPAQAFAGSYVLTGFELTDAQGNRITQANVASFSGTAVVTATRYSQTVQVNGNAPVTLAGSWSGDPLSGSITVVTDAGVTGPVGVTFGALTVVTETDARPAGLLERDFWLKVGNGREAAEEDDEDESP